MSNIKAIQTWYKGYHFRSRLEARWAVLFDAMNEEWYYEPEGYVIDGTPYLPDFYLPRFGFFEVKNPAADFDDSLLYKFADEVNRLVILGRDIPDPSVYNENLMTREHAGDEGTKSYLDVIQPHWIRDRRIQEIARAENPTERKRHEEFYNMRLPNFFFYRRKVKEYEDWMKKNGAAGIDTIEGGEDDQFYADDGSYKWDNSRKVGLWNDKYFSMKDDYNKTRLYPPTHAFIAARSARFEHGEKGSTVL